MMKKFEINLIRDLSKEASKDDSKDTSKYPSKCLKRYLKNALKDTTKNALKDTAKKSPKQGWVSYVDQFISEEILEKIRERVMFITYYGGKVLDTRNGRLAITKAIIDEIRNVMRMSGECECKRNEEGPRD